MEDHRRPKFQRGLDGNLEFSHVVDIGAYSNEQIRIHLDDENVLSVWAETGPNTSKCLRRFELPRGVDISQLQTLYTNDNKLVLQAPILVNRQPQHFFTSSLNPTSILQPSQPHRPADDYFTVDRAAAKVSLLGRDPHISLEHSLPGSGLLRHLPRSELLGSGSGLLSMHRPSTDLFVGGGGTLTRKPQFEEILHLGPNFKPEDIRVSVEKGMVHIQAEYRGEDVHPSPQGEMPSIEKYSKKFTFPPEYDEQRILAKLHNGVLYITAPMKLNSAITPLSNSNLSAIPDLSLKQPQDLGVTFQSDASRFHEEVLLDTLFKQDNVEVAIQDHAVLIQGHATRVDATTGRVHASHILRYEVQVPHTVDVSQMSARWIGTNRILLEAPCHLQSPVINWLQPSSLFMSSTSPLRRTLLSPSTFFPQTSTTPSNNALYGGLDMHPEKFIAKLKMDLSLKPSELNVSVTPANVVIIEARHEDSNDESGHHVAKSIKKQHTLPKEVDGDALKASWLDEGYLMLEAPYKLLHNSEANKLGDVSNNGHSIPVHRKAA